MTVFRATLIAPSEAGPVAAPRARERASEDYLAVADNDNDEAARGASPDASGTSRSEKGEPANGGRAPDRAPDRRDAAAASVPSEAQAGAGNWDGEEEPEFRRSSSERAALAPPPSQSSALASTTSSLQGAAADETGEVDEAAGEGEAGERDRVGPGSAIPLLGDSGVVRFGSYVLLEELSHTPNGVVYRAAHEALHGREVALKLLLNDDHPDQQDRASRFQREIENIAKLRHPNIVTVYEVGEIEGITYFAMEYVRGCSLAQWIRTHGPLRPADAADLCAKLARAIHYAHARGIIHRDIKPDNVLLDEESGEPLVADFGLARDIKLDIRITQSGVTVGTPPYMPPEQARGQQELLDSRSDVYALGATLYEMVVGRPPFDGETGLQVMMRVIERQPVRPRRIDPSLPADLEAIILKCLSKRMRERYENAELLARDLGRFRQGQWVNARKATVLNRAGRFVRAYRDAVYFLFAIAVVSAVFLASSYLTTGIQDGGTVTVPLPPPPTARWADHVLVGEVRAYPTEVWLNPPADAASRARNEHATPDAVATEGDLDPSGRTTHAAATPDAARDVARAIARPLLEPFDLPPLGPDRRAVPAALTWQSPGTLREVRVLYPEPIGVSDFTFEFRALFWDGIAPPNLGIFIVRDEAAARPLDPRMGPAIRNGYTIWLGNAGNSRATIERNGQLVMADASHRLEPQTERPYRVRLKVVAGTIEIEVRDHSGRWGASYTDPQPLVFGPGARLGFVTYGATVTLSRTVLAVHSRPAPSTLAPLDAGDLLFRMHAYDAALAEFNQVWHIAHRSGDVAVEQAADMRRAITQDVLGTAPLSQTIRELERLVRDQPQSRNLSRALFGAYLRHGDYEHAVDLFRQLIPRLSDRAQAPTPVDRSDIELVPVVAGPPTREAPAESSGVPASWAFPLVRREPIEWAAPSDSADVSIRPATASESRWVVPMGLAAATELIDDLLRVGPPLDAAAPWGAPQARLERERVPLGTDPRWPNYWRGLIAARTLLALVREASLGPESAGRHANAPDLAMWADTWVVEASLLRRMPPSTTRDRWRTALQLALEAAVTAQIDAIVPRRVASIRWPWIEAVMTAASPAGLDAPGALAVVLDRLLDESLIGLETDPYRRLALVKIARIAGPGAITEDRARALFALLTGERVGTEAAEPSDAPLTRETGARQQQP